MPMLGHTLDLQGKPSTPARAVAPRGGGMLGAPPDAEPTAPFLAQRLAERTARWKWEQPAEHTAFLPDWPDTWADRLKMLDRNIRSLTPGMVTPDMLQKPGRESDLVLLRLASRVYDFPLIGAPLVALRKAAEPALGAMDTWTEAIGAYPIGFRLQQQRDNPFQYYEHWTRAGLPESKAKVAELEAAGVERDPLDWQKTLRNLQTAHPYYIENVPEQGRNVAEFAAGLMLPSLPLRLGPTNPASIARRGAAELLDNAPVSPSLWDKAATPVWNFLNETMPGTRYTGITKARRDADAAHMYAYNVLGTDAEDLAGMVSRNVDDTVTRLQEFVADPKQGGKYGPRAEIAAREIGQIDLEGLPAVKAARQQPGAPLLGEAPQVNVPQLVGELHDEIMWRRYDAMGMVEHTADGGRILKLPRYIRYPNALKALESTFYLATPRYVITNATNNHLTGLYYGLSPIADVAEMKRVAQAFPVPVNVAKYIREGVDPEVYDFAAYAGMTGKPAELVQKIPIYGRFVKAIRKVSQEGKFVGEGPTRAKYYLQLLNRVHDDIWGGRGRFLPPELRMKPDLPPGLAPDVAQTVDNIISQGLVYRDMRRQLERALSGSGPMVQRVVGPDSSLTQSEIGAIQEAIDQVIDNGGSTDEAAAAIADVRESIRQQREAGIVDNELPVRPTDHELTPAHLHEMQGAHVEGPNDEAGMKLFDQVNRQYMGAVSQVVQHVIDNPNLPMANKAIVDAWFNLHEHWRTAYAAADAMRRDAYDALSKGARAAEVWPRYFAKRTEHWQQFMKGLPDLAQRQIALIQDIASGKRAPNPDLDPLARFSQITDNLKQAEDVDFELRVGRNRTRVREAELSAFDAAVRHYSTTGDPAALGWYVAAQREVSRLSAKATAVIDATRPSLAFTNPAEWRRWAERAWNALASDTEAVYRDTRTSIELFGEPPKWVGDGPSLRAARQEAERPDVLRRLAEEADILVGDGPSPTLFEEAQTPAPILPEAVPTTVGEAPAPIEAPPALTAIRESNVQLAEQLGVKDEILERAAAGEDPATIARAMREEGKLPESYDFTPGEMAAQVEPVTMTDRAVVKSVVEAEQAAPAPTVAPPQDVTALRQTAGQAGIGTATEAGVPYDSHLLNALNERFTVEGLPLLTTNKAIATKALQEMTPAQWEVAKDEMMRRVQAKQTGEPYKPGQPTLPLPTAPDAPTSFIDHPAHVMTREQVATAWRDFWGLSPQETDEVMAVLDARAKVWARQTGSDPADWYSKHIAGIKRGDVGDVQAQDLLQSAPPADIWYSGLRQLLDEKMPNRASADQVRAIARGAKGDEVKWTGLEDFLQGKGTVTKKELLEWMDGHGVTVRDKVRGTSPTGEYGQLLREMERADREYDRLLSLEDNSPEITASMQAVVRQRVDLMDRIRALKEPGYAAKYESYTLPGGENYREVELIWDKPGSSKLAVLNRNGAIDSWLEQPPTAEQMDFLTNAGYTVREMPTPDAPGNFKSGHFPEANVLAHVRFNERTIDGKRTLFIEEIQSDWHEQGRKKGYKPSADETKALEAERMQAIRDFEQARREHPEWYWRANDEAWRTRDWAAQTFPVQWGRIQDLNQKLNAIDGVPPAPFASTWHELAFKRMVRWASEHGFDQIGWTTGAQQAQRYSLAQHVDKILYWPQAEYMTATKRGTTVFEGTVPRDKLPEYVGGELAQRLLDTPNANPYQPHELSGPDLQIGGVGMSGFYDKMLPDFARKYGKRWGAQVQQGKLINKAEANALAELRRGDPGFIGDERLTYQPIWTMPVTDAMRQSVMQGQPLFQDLQGVAKGASHFLDDGRAVLTAFQQSDFSTAVHETAHVFRRDLARVAATDEAAASDLTTLEKWAGAKGGKWTRDAEEKVAVGFEEYLASGKAPTRELQSVFDRFREWLLAIYKNVRNIGGNITPEVRAVFDRLLAETDEMIPVRSQKQAIEEAGQAMQRQALELERAAPTLAHDLDWQRARNDITNGVTALRNPDYTYAQLRSAQQSMQRSLDRMRQMVETAPKAAVQPGVVGKPVKAWLDPDNPYNLRYEAVELDDLIASHTPDGRPNPRFPAELQPRARDQAASRLQIQDIANHLSPDEWLGHANTLDRGSPIIGPDNLVESGNGRVAAVRMTSPEQAAAMRAALTARAAEFGLDPQAIAAMRNPVLVRRRMKDVDRVRFVWEAAKPATLTMNMGELAAGRAAAITAEDMQAFKQGAVSAREAISAARNADFGSRFLGRLSPNEQAGLVDAQGVLNVQGVDAIYSALFSSAFPKQTQLVQDFILSPEPGAASIANGLNAALGKLALLQKQIEAGAVKAEYGLAQPLADAILKNVAIREGKSPFRTVEELLAQGGLFGDELGDVERVLLRTFEDNKRNGKVIGQVLNRYVESVLENGQTADTLFAMPALPADDLMRQAMRGPQGNLFDELPDTLYQTMGGSGVDPATLPDAMPPNSADRLDLDAQRKLNDVDRIEAALKDGTLVRSEEMTPEIRQSILDWADNEVQPRFEQSKLLAANTAGRMADDIMLNYGLQRDFDILASFAFPYHYWYTRSAWNWMQRLIHRPGLLLSYNAMRKEIRRRREEDKGLRPRFKDSIKIPLPAGTMPTVGGADMADELYVNPMRLLIPFANFLNTTRWDDAEEANDTWSKVLGAQQTVGLNLHPGLQQLLEKAAGEPGRGVRDLFPPADYISAASALVQPLAPNHIPPAGFMFGPTWGTWDLYVLNRALASMAAQQMQMDGTDYNNPQEVLDASKRAGKQDMNPLLPYLDAQRQVEKWMRGELQPSEITKLRENKLIYNAMRAAGVERAIPVMSSFLTALRLRPILTGEKTRVQVQNAKAAMGYGGEVAGAAGTREDVKAISAANPFERAGMSAYGAAPGPSTSSGYKPAAEGVYWWTFGEQRRGEVNTSYDDQAAALIGKDPANHTALRALEDKRFAELDAIEEQIPKEDDNRLLWSTYGANPQEVVQIRSDQILSELNKTEPPVGEYTGVDGKTDWAAYFNAKDEWYANLPAIARTNPQIQAVLAGLGGSLMSRDSILATLTTRERMEAYDRRYHDPLRALHEVVWDAYKAPDDAYYAEIRQRFGEDIYDVQDGYFAAGGKGSAGRRRYLAAHPQLKRYWDNKDRIRKQYPSFAGGTAASFIDDVLAAYPEKNWTAEELAALYATVPAIPGAAAIKKINDPAAAETKAAYSSSSYSGSRYRRRYYSRRYYRRSYRRSGGGGGLSRPRFFPRLPSYRPGSLESRSITYVR